jgi:hypothetical protein
MRFDLLALPRHTLALGFVQWDQMHASIASTPASGASSEPQGEGL